MSNGCSRTPPARATPLPRPRSLCAFLHGSNHPILAHSPPVLSAVQHAVVCGRRGGGVHARLVAHGVRRGAARNSRAAPVGKEAWQCRVDAVMVGIEVFGAACSGRNRNRSRGGVELHEGGCGLWTV